MSEDPDRPASWPRSLADPTSALATLETTDEPSAVLALAPRAGLVSPVAVLSGAFDPPTLAHLTLARAALRSAAGSLLFLVAVRTIDKERGTAASLALRLRMLRALAARRPRLGLVVVNQGLYVDQARALLRVGVEKPWFLIGYDKVPQIFDARYYQDRAAALDRLFELARLLVVPRQDQGAAALEAFLRLPDQARYASFVRPLALRPSETRALHDLSSTRVRRLAASDGDWRALVPREVRRLMERDGAYCPAATSSAATASGLKR